MKRLISTVAFCCMATGTSHASLKLVGIGDTLRFDPSSFPPQMKTNYEIMKIKCIKCHPLERTVVAIKRGIAPISGLPFDRNAITAYGLKMKRRPDSNMKNSEVKACVDLMNYLLDEASK